MMRELSIFTGSEDVERALGLLVTAADGGPRAKDVRRGLHELQAWFCARDASAKLATLGRRLGVDATELPGDEEMARLFADEILSAKALRLHRGRSVYSAGKAALWNRLWMPFRDALMPDAETLALLERLIALHTDAGGGDVEACVGLLVAELAALGFDVEQVREPGHAPLLIARRDAIDSDGCVALYGHYDVENPDLSKWQTDPWSMTEFAGRLYGVGIGDNKAALAMRLRALRSVTKCPALVWVIQGEEEVGSPLAHRTVGGQLEGLDAGLWLEENGYFERDGRQRLLARTIGASPDSTEPVGLELQALIDELAAIGARFGVAHHVETRGMNKAFFATGCPFNNALPTGARYLAIGVNDPDTHIHQANESVPMWTFPIAVRQFQASLAWAGRSTVEVQS